VTTSRWQTPIFMIFLDTTLVKCSNRALAWKWLPNFKQFRVHQLFVIFKKKWTWVRFFKSVAGIENRNWKTRKRELCVIVVKLVNSGACEVFYSLLADCGCARRLVGVAQAVSVFCGKCVT
jgi:hypothetical protein